jgi:hypothetical protein
MILKALAALALGFAVIAGLQTAGVWSLQRYLKSERAQAGLPPMGKTPDFAANFKGGNIGSIMPKYPAIDTTAAQRLGVEGAQRRIDMQVRNAQSYVPLPPRPIPGLRR